MGLSAADREFYRENGFLVVPGLLSPEEVAALRARADAIATGEIPIPQGEVVGGRATGVSRRKAGAPPARPGSAPAR